MILGHSKTGKVLISDEVKFHGAVLIKVSTEVGLFTFKGKNILEAILLYFSNWCVATYICKRAKLQNGFIHIATLTSSIIITNAVHQPWRKERLSACDVCCQSLFLHSKVQSLTLLGADRNTKWCRGSHRKRMSPNSADDWLWFFSAKH